MPQTKIAVGEIASTVIAGDDQLRLEIRELIHDIIEQMRYTMRHGSVSERLQLAKSITPQLLGALNSVDQGEAARTRRDAYERLLGEVRGDITVAKG